MIEIGGAVTEPFTCPWPTWRRFLGGSSPPTFTASPAGPPPTCAGRESRSRPSIDVIEPSVQPGTSVTHVVFGGLDGYRSIVSIEDALTDDVLIAEHLDGRPLDGDHGAPARLVSPSQYGFVSTKHLCRIELHTAEPTDAPTASLAGRLRSPLLAHPRARVWEEERHRYLPAWSVRPVYRLLIPPIAFLSARGSRRSCVRLGVGAGVRKARRSCRRARAAPRAPGCCPRAVRRMSPTSVMTERHSATAPQSTATWLAASSASASASSMISPSGPRT